MTESISFIISALLTYQGFDLGERFLKRDKDRDIRVILRGFHVHHSFYGVIAFLLGVLFLSGVPAIISYGFALGNIWQHKRTHNRVNENGLLIITKAK